ncbi:MAG: hypothetical protein JST53_00455 [Actinobacteria bacterium]|nr:hypothetical protein [Actinomycetota bacterium]
MPLAYPLPAEEILVDEDESEGEGDRRFVSGPLSVGLAMLITPTCSMRAQGDAEGYAHPVRTLVPLRPVQELTELGVLDPARLRLAEKRDALINYMFVPGSSDLGIEDSFALLYMPVTLHHKMIDEQRVTQLTYDAASQLQKKLTWHASSVLLQRDDFDPPMD